MYSNKLLEHFTRPLNVGILENPDGYARVSSPVHSDELELYMQVQDGRVAQIKYRVHGCAAAIASASAFSGMAQGMPLESAEKLTAEDVAAALGGLPEHKTRCSVLGPEALRQAINQYNHREGS